MEAVTGFVGRAHELEEVSTAIRRGANVLVTGRAGIGKSAFLRQVMRVQMRERACVWLPAGTTKNALLELARQVHELRGLAVPETLLPPKIAAQARRQQWLPWEVLSRSVRRLAVAPLAELLVNNLRERNLLVYMEALEVPPSQANFFTEVLDVTQVVAAMDDANRRRRIARVLWRFQTQLELKPLPLEHCTTITERWLDYRPLRFSDERTRRRFIRHVARDSGGVPSAIEGMLEAASGLHEITPAKARAIGRHESSLRYLDLTPVVVLGLVVFIALRYVSRGIGEIELLVLSGVGAAVFMGLRFFLWRLSRSA